MTVEDLLPIVGEKSSLGKTIKQMPRLVQIKYLVTIRVLVTLMFEPTAGLWNGLMDRMEGEVTDTTQVNNKLEIANIQEIIEKVYGTHEDSSK